MQPEWRANTDTRAIVYNYIYGTPQMDASKYVTTKEKRRRSRSRTDGKGNLSGLSGPVGDDTSKRATLVQHNIKQIEEQCGVRRPEKRHGQTMDNIMGMIDAQPTAYHPRRPLHNEEGGKPVRSFHLEYVPCTMEYRVKPRDRNTCIGDQYIGISNTTVRRPDLDPPELRKTESKSRYRRSASAMESSEDGSDLSHTRRSRRTLQEKINIGSQSLRKRTTPFKRRTDAQHVV